MAGSFSYDSYKPNQSSRYQENVPTGPRVQFALKPSERSPPSKVRRTSKLKDMNQFDQSIEPGLRLTNETALNQNKQSKNGIMIKGLSDSFRSNSYVERDPRIQAREAEEKAKVEPRFSSITSELHKTVNTASGSPDTLSPVVDTPLSTLSNESATHLFRPTLTPISNSNPSNLLPLRASCSKSAENPAILAYQPISLNSTKRSYSTMTTGRKDDDGCHSPSEIDMSSTVSSLNSSLNKYQVPPPPPKFFSKDDGQNSKMNDLFNCLSNFASQIKAETILKVEQDTKDRRLEKELKEYEKDAIFHHDSVSNPKREVKTQAISLLKQSLARIDAKLLETEVQRNICTTELVNKIFDIQDSQAPQTQALDEAKLKQYAHDKPTQTEQHDEDMRGIANQALRKSHEAFRRADEALYKSDKAYSKVDHAVRDASIARSDADHALSLAQASRADQGQSKHIPSLLVRMNELEHNVNTRRPKETNTGLCVSGKYHGSLSSQVEDLERDVRKLKASSDHIGPVQDLVKAVKSQLNEQSKQTLKHNEDIQKLMASRVEDKKKLEDFEKGHAQMTITLQSQEKQLLELDSVQTKLQRLEISAAQVKAEFAGFRGLPGKLDELERSIQQTAKIVALLERLISGDADIENLVDNGEESPNSKCFLKVLSDIQQNSLAIRKQVHRQQARLETIASRIAATPLHSNKATSSPAGTPIPVADRSSMPDVDTTKATQQELDKSIREMEVFKEEQKLKDNIVGQEFAAVHERLEALAQRVTELDVKLKELSRGLKSAPNYLSGSTLLLGDIDNRLRNLEESCAAKTRYEKEHTDSHNVIITQMDEITERLIPQKCNSRDFAALSSQVINMQGFLRSLDDRFNNLTTEPLVEAMTQRIGQMYPEPRIMQQQIETISKNLQIHMQRGLTVQNSLEKKIKEIHMSMNKLQIFVSGTLSVRVNQLENSLNGSITGANSINLNPTAKSPEISHSAPTTYAQGFTPVNAGPPAQDRTGNC
ncbi:MAG: hypothetical protein M1834_001806 [Cirrosporium novae-zelandiae]|nr:MAG: hypothetical protein M1834_001806 [Cirrosporium novae-zelandiae]